MPTSPLPNCAVSLGPDPLCEAVVVVVPLSSPQAARKAVRAADPPVSAMNFRRETGSLARRETALPGTSSLCLLSGMSSLLGGLRFQSPYAASGRPDHF